MIPKISTGVKLIGISGHAGSGKDSIANYLHTAYQSAWILPLAGPLKMACAEAFGIDIDSFHNQELKETSDPFWSQTPRKIAQFVGTEFFRDQIWKIIFADSQDFWLKRMTGMLNSQLSGERAVYNSDDIAIIPDIRFQNEYDWLIANNGIHIHLTRPGADGTVGIPNHPSEKGFTITRPDKTSLLFNTGTLQELYSSVDKALSSFSFPRNLNLF